MRPSAPNEPYLGGASAVTVQAARGRPLDRDRRRDRPADIGGLRSLRGIRRGPACSEGRSRVTNVSSKKRLEDHLLSISRGAAAPPPVLRDTRRELAAEFFRGSGIEVGALHLPMAMPTDVIVRYVDRMTVPEL